MLFPYLVIVILLFQTSQTRDLTGEAERQNAA